MTGCVDLEGAKLVGLLKEIAPRITRISVMVNPGSPTSERLSVAVAAAVGQQSGVEVNAIEAREAVDIEAAFTRLSRDPDHRLIVWPDPVLNGYRKFIVELAARHGLPAIYGVRTFTAEVGLISYGVDLPDLLPAGGRVRGSHPKG